MKRLAVVLTVLTLGACAAQPQGEAPAAAAPPQPAAPQPRAAQPPGGQWLVSEDFAAEPVGTLKSPFAGRTVELNADRAVDAAGRLCKAPRYAESMTPALLALGRPAQPQAARDALPRRTVTVTCDGADFAVLVAQPDGSWLTRQDGWVLKLERETPIQAQAEPQHAAAPPPPPAPPAKAAPRQDPRTLVYLASYPDEARARAGFKVLAKVSPILAKQQPVTQTVNLGKKGKWVRLYGMAASEGERKTICSQLGKQVDECGARNRE